MEEQYETRQQWSQVPVLFCAKQVPYPVSPRHWNPPETLTPCPALTAPGLVKSLFLQARIEGYNNYYLEVCNMRSGNIRFCRFNSKSHFILKLIRHLGTKCRSCHPAVSAALTVAWTRQCFMVLSNLILLRFFFHLTSFILIVVQGNHKL